MKKTMGLMGRHGLARLNFLKKTQGGFTLIELLVVISIISLLSSVVLAAMNGARVKADDTQRNQIVGEYVKKLVAHFLKHLGLITPRYPFFNNFSIFLQYEHQRF